MTTYRHKQHVRAVQWNRHGDHERVESASPVKPGLVCWKCKKQYADHGWNVGAPIGDMIVCPGDIIITHADGRLEAMKPGPFAATFEEVEGGESR